MYFPPIFYQLNKPENYQPVLSVDNFFTEAELDGLNQQLSKVQAKAAIAGHSGEDIKSEEEFIEAMNNTHQARKSNVYWCTDPEYKWVYDKLAIAINHVNLTNFNKLLYGIEALQYTEYDSKYNGFYKPHLDTYDKGYQYPNVRTLSFSLQLSRDEDYTGGDVLLYENDIVMKAHRKYGTITFFDSTMLHEVTPVTSGFRKSLVGWIVGPRV